jgi:hypothetical protein
MLMYTTYAHRLLKRCVTNTYASIDTVYTVTTHDSTQQQQSTVTTHHSTVTTRHCVEHLALSQCQVTDAILRILLRLLP